jgi:hypothetical protein
MNEIAVLYLIVAIKRVAGRSCMVDGSWGARAARVATTSPTSYSDAHSCSWWERRGSVRQESALLRITSQMLRFTWIVWWTFSKKAMLHSYIIWNTSLFLIMHARATALIVDWLIQRLAQSHILQLAACSLQHMRMGRWWSWWSCMYGWLAGWCIMRMHACMMAACSMAAERNWNF